MIELKDPIENHNNKVCQEIDEHNKKIPLKRREELNSEATSYANSLFAGRKYYVPSERYRENYNRIFGKTNV